jgi:phosphatidylethanolamine-binding protein (PEBP) family uncharacterized protein
MSYALTMRDTVNMAIHWVIWDIPAATTTLAASLPAGAMPAAPAPAGSMQEDRFNTNAAYFGPGANFRAYEFVLWAVKTPKLNATGTTAAIYQSLPASSIASAKLTVWGSVDAMCP